MDPINERTVYIRFPYYQHTPEDMPAIELLFSQFGGLVDFSMKNGFAFATYQSAKYALYICDMLNEIQFMGGRLKVRPRENSRLDQEFRSYEHTFRYQPWKPVPLNQLNELDFSNFDVKRFLDMEEAQMEAKRASRN